jgi:hypothetical protein
MHLIKKMANNITNLIKRAYVSLVGNDAQEYQITQISYLNKTNVMEVIYPYGVSGNPPRNSLVLMFNVQGQEENRAGIANLPQQRFRNLKEGEVAVGNYLTRSNIKFAENGDVVVTTKNNQEVTIDQNANISVSGDATVNVSGSTTLTSSGTTVNSDVQLNGNLTVTGSATLGSGSGTQKAIATVGSTTEVTITSGSSAGTYQGQVTSGSGNSTTS